MTNSLNYEDCVETIDTELAKRRNKWQLNALCWLNYEDVSQIIRFHIFKKWSMWDQKRPLAPWLNTIISHQISNIIRNVHGNYSRPCLRCAAAEGGDLCAIYGKQCGSCPLYAAWEKNKKQAYDIKIPVSIENHTQEVYDLQEDFIDIDRAAEILHDKVAKTLKPNELKVYQLLYMEHLKEDEVAKRMGFRTNEAGRRAGYKQIKNIKKAIIQKVKSILYGDGLDP